MTPAAPPRPAGNVDRSGRPRKVGIDHHSTLCRPGRCVCAYPGRPRHTREGRP